MAISELSIESRVRVRRRYVRSVDLARDVDDTSALKGYVVTPSVRDGALRILAGISPESSQRAFRVVGPYGVGKSAFGVFLAQLLREQGQGVATSLLSGATDEHFDVAPWRPVVISGRRVCFARELLRTATSVRDVVDVELGEIATRAQAMLSTGESLDAYEVTEILAAVAAEFRSQTGRGLLLLIDEMGRFIEHAAVSNEDPSIFQILAERSGGRSGTDLAVVGFLHHRFADYVSGLGGWIEAEWTRSAERYEEIAFASSTEQSMFMLSRALRPVRQHTASVRKRSEDFYEQAVDRGLFSAARADVVAVAPNLYPLHPSAIATLACGMLRFGQNERSLFSFLQSLEPAGFKRFAHVTQYGVDYWYRTPMAFDHLAATISHIPGGDRARRWSMARDALAAATDLSPMHRDVLKTVALFSVLEPIPGLVANAETIAWSVGINEVEAERILEELVTRKVLYHRSHRSDYCLWSSSSVDLSRWLEEARTNVAPSKRIKNLDSLLTFPRPAIAHRHYHATGTLRSFQVRLWTGGNPTGRKADGLILVAPLYPDEDINTVLYKASEAVKDDPLALVCARTVIPADLKWAYELELWTWIRSNCEDLKVDDLARAEVEERIAAATQALTRTTALLSMAKSDRKEEWWYRGNLIDMPDGLSAGLSNICDEVYAGAPILRNELINRSRLSTAIASARTRLLDRMLNYEDLTHLGLEGAPPERTIYLSMFFATGMHAEDKLGKFAFCPPHGRDPYRWRPVWDRIEERLGRDEPVSCGALMKDLARPPYGLRAGPALLAIAAYLIASRDRIALMERNSYQPELSTAHFVRMAKSPSKFALRSLQQGPVQEGIARALASRLTVIGESRPVLSAISEELFGWYNSLPPYALRTKSLSPLASEVRTVLRKASEPGRLFFHDLPLACGVKRDDGRIDIERFAISLDEALGEISEVMPKLRSQAAAAVKEAFGARDMASLRSQLQVEFEPHRSELVDHRLRVFLERAANTEASDERWLDGIAGHLTGQRPDNWDENTLKRFEFEVRTVAEQLAKWLALARPRGAGNGELRSVHVIGIDGRERVVVVRRDRPKPALKMRLNAVREALGNDPSAVEVLGQLLAEYAEDPGSQREEREASST